MILRAAMVMVLLAPAAAPASAEPAPATCVRTVLPAALAAWRRPPVALAAGTDPAREAGVRLTVGRPAALVLHPSARLSLAAAPGKAAPGGSHGGLVRFAAARSGVYRVAIGAGAWIDVVAGGRALPSIAHGHGPECSGIAKMVDFRLARGNYVLQLTGSADPRLTVLITPIR